MRTRLFKILALGLMVVLIGGCTGGTPEPTGTPTANDSSLGMGLSNPASVNCADKGGTLTILSRGDLGEYGVCTFAENFQCEEWALYRGECPVGGVDVSGYVTPQAVFCAITGGTYTAGDNAGTADEKGTCEFPNGWSCDALDYFNGACSPEA